MICPRCEQGSILTATISVTSKTIYVCEECEATWFRKSDIGKVQFEDFGTYMESINLPPLWTELLMKETASADSNVASDLIISVLADIKEFFLDNTEQNVLDLLESNEIGIALELLCSQIIEYEINISLINKEKLLRALKLLGLPLSIFEQA